MGNYSRLRPYQVEGIQDCVDILTSKKKRSMEIVVAPTAAGKSLYISNTVSRVDEPILVLQPSKELLSQNYEKFVSIGGEASICCASLKTKTLDRIEYTEIDGKLVPCREVGRVTYATVGSVKAYKKALKKMGVTRAIIDEASLMTKSGSQIRKLFDDVGITHVVGLTATPIYLDGGLNGALLKMMNRVRGRLFSTIRSVTQISELVDEGYWTKLQYQVNDTDESYLEHNSSGSDYKIESLVEYYKANGLNERIAEEVEISLSEGRKSILVFVPTIEDSEKLCKLFPDSYAVHSKMDLEVRDKAIRDFKDMKVPVIFNVNILSFGFDHPQLDCIITARPTSSVAMYYQQLGRGVRIHPLKDNCKVVDFSGNVKKFGTIEGLHFEDLPGYGWGMFNASNQLLTGFPISAKNRPTKRSLIAKYSRSNIQRNSKPTGPSMRFWFGKYSGKTVRQVAKENKGYLSWMYDNFNFNTDKTKIIKREIEEILVLEKTHK